MINIFNFNLQFLLTALLFFAVSIKTLSASGYSSPVWSRLMSDKGALDSRWHMVSSPRRLAEKTLKLNFPLAEISEAVLEYKLQVAPYDPLLKQHILQSENYNWGNILIEINGKTLLNEAAGKYISKGTHHLALPLEMLKEGENKILVTWVELSKEEREEKKRYGYIYFSRDPPEKTKDIQEALQIRILLKFKEYNDY